MSAVDKAKPAHVAKAVSALLADVTHPEFVAAASQAVPTAEIKVV
jgi:hypothetical protein